MAKTLTPDQLAGMTVNERLFEAGLLDAYDQAVTSRNPERVRTILERVHIGESDIAAIIQVSIPGSSG